MKIKSQIIINAFFVCFFIIYLFIYFLVRSNGQTNKKYFLKSILPCSDFVRVNIHKQHKSQNIHEFEVQVEIAEKLAKHQL